MPRILTDEETRAVREDGLGRVKPVARGKRRAARALGQSTTSFFRMDQEDRQILHEISKVGRGRL